MKSKTYFYGLLGTLSFYSNFLNYFVFRFITLIGLTFFGKILLNCFLKFIGIPLDWSPHHFPKIIS